MKRTAQDILNFVEDNDVKFAKLTFCDNCLMIFRFIRKSSL
mgnify:CR=1 FL=1